jgi:DNA-binding winged helix-turn-helix (wHTH) protein
VKYQLTNNLFFIIETLRIVYCVNDSEESSIRLSQPEANILLFLVKKNGNIITKSQLLEAGWGEREVGTNSINVAIYNLRKALSIDENINLENVPKIGYRLSVIDFSPKILESISNQSNTNETVQMDTIENAQTESSHSYSLAKKVLVITTLFAVNILFFKFLALSYINLTTVKCISNGNGTVCFSDRYSQDDVEIQPGITLLSNLFSFNNTNIEIESK